MRWEIEPDVDLRVLLWGSVGPYDNAFAQPIYDITRYVRGQGIEIKRGRSDEFQGFQAGICKISLKNNGREFDPSLTGTWLELPGVAGSTATAMDSTSFGITDLDIRVWASAVDWTPGGFGKVLLSQWGSAGNEGWLFGLSSAGNLQLSFTTDGTTDLNRTSTVVPGFVDGSSQWIRATLDANNGAAGHDVKFWRSIDGVTWVQVGTTVTTAGTVTPFNSSADMIIGDISAGGLTWAGNVRKVEVRNGIDGVIVADPDFTGLSTHHMDLTDRRGNEWMVNGAAMIGYDDDASPFAPALQPMRRLQVIATYNETDRVLFTGYVDGWPRTWTSTTGTVDVTATDALGVMARAVISPSHGVLTLDDPIHGRLDAGRLAGDLPEQTSGERVTSLLQLAGFTAGANLIADTGLTQVMEIEPTGNILQLVQDAELAEAGFFFVDKDGQFQFYDRHSRFQKLRTADVQAVFTDDQYSGLEVDRNLTQVWNDVTFSRPTMADHDEPNHQHFTDHQSLHDLGILSYSRELPVISDGETLARAEFWVDRYGHPKDRPSPITVRPRKNMAALFAVCAGMELLDRVQILRTPLQVGPTTTFTGLVEQVEHRITNESWETTFAISLIDVDDGAGFLILDDATLGQLGVGALAY